MRAAMLLLVMLLTTMTTWADVLRTDATEGNTVTLTTGTTEVTLQDGDVLTGTGGTNTHVSIADGATVTLSNANIIRITNDNSYKWAGITCLGDATIILEGNNALKGGYRTSGIYVPKSKTLVIRGDGSLTATGNKYAAGIGSGYQGSCGNIIIEGGIITATGGEYAAGIGGGHQTSCDNITITGGTVTATGGSFGAGIGSGYNKPCGNITITGGTVTATGGSHAAGIGSGRGGSCGDINITRTVISVTAMMKINASSYCIGAGDEGTCGTVMVGGAIGAISESPYTYVPSGSTSSTVQFDANGGTGTMDDWLFTCDGTWQSIPACTFTAPDGYLFSGWNTAANGSGIFYQDGQQIVDISEVTLYAQWVLPSCIISTDTKELKLLHGQTLTGMGGKYTHVTIADGATVTLNGVKITDIPYDKRYQWAGITCEGDATIILEGNNALKGGYNSSGIYVPKDKTLVIRGDGSLTATGVDDAAGIGSGNHEASGNITIEGGTITAIAGKYGAGIGSGRSDGSEDTSSSCGDITIIGGNITATCKVSGAGIGSGNKASCGNITIEGCTINSTGGSDAAGIGGGSGGSYGNITIYSGDITATSKGNGASIGSGRGNSSYGTIAIYGGSVTATSKENGAGIGSGYGQSCADIIITGGDITATGGSKGAGIGGGYQANCGDITITGGTITATSKGNGAGIGSGEGLSSTVYTCGNITLSGGDITVTGGTNGAGIGSGPNSTCGDITITNGVTRVIATKTANNSKIDIIGKGYNGTVGTITIDPSLIDETRTIETSYNAETDTYKYNYIRTLWGLALLDNSDNAEAIGVKDGLTTDVLLRSRTLYKDGAWNTLCLPFDVTIAGSPLEGADVRELIPASSGLNGSTLTLNFTAENEVTQLVAGTPYLIKWTKADDYVDDAAHNIVNPMFTSVTIKSTTPKNDYTFTGGKFVGSYDPVGFTAGNRSILYLGAANKLYWPNADMTLGACRAYFELGTSPDPSEGGESDAIQINLNFDGDGEATKITTTDCTDLTDYDGAWYDLQGRKIANGSKPTAKGVYIHNGLKVVIK